MPFLSAHSAKLPCTVLQNASARIGKEATRQRVIQKQPGPSPYFCLSFTTITYVAKSIIDLS
jgi:hypothetical protein